jgi:hypothetical protein
MKTTIKILIIAMFLVVLSVVINGQSYDSGCCINPNADDMRRCSSFGISATGCCPPDGEYTAEGGPTTQDECLTGGYFKVESCDAVTECTTQKCCCTETPSQKPETQCPSQVKDLPAGVGETCSDVCADASDSIGVCELINLIITPLLDNDGKIQRGFGLVWEYGCGSDVSSYKIERCSGGEETCGSSGEFQPIAESNNPQEHSYMDDSNLLFDKDYTYKLEVNYGTDTY